MICPKCKATVKEGTKFCSTCGTEIPQDTICPQCGKELKDNMKFCPNCGYEVLVGSISEKEEMRFDSGDSNDSKEEDIISKEIPNNNDKASEPNTIVEDDTPLDDAGIALMKKWMIGTYIASFAGIFIFFSMGGFSSSIWWWITFVVFILVALATYGLKDDKTKKTLDALKGMVLTSSVICFLMVGCMGSGGGSGTSRDFSGDYYISCQNMDYWLTVYEDGRCVHHSKNLIKDGYQDEYIGTIVPIASNAFRISGTTSCIYGINQYNPSDEFCGYTHRTEIFEFVFDLSNNTVYFSASDFKGSDIATPYHGKFHKN